MPKPKSKPKGTGRLLIGVGTILASTVISGFILGYLTDAWLETAPIFMLAFGGLGFIGGLLKVYKLLTNPDFFN
ncbi:MAG: AtpZ/AtpI family protein [Gammaproteobacteria bacterium]|nr:AtpZ/AtpI family protein [Gammaproteobacteria bacterium]